MGFTLLGRPHSRLSLPLPGMGDGGHRGLCGDHPSSARRPSPATGSCVVSARLFEKVAVNKSQGRTKSCGNRAAHPIQPISHPAHPAAATVTVTVIVTTLATPSTTPTPHPHRPHRPASTCRPPCSHSSRHTSPNPDPSRPSSPA
jgi:hypothetical protein